MKEQLLHNMLRYVTKDSQMMRCTPIDYEFLNKCLYSALIDNTRNIIKHINYIDGDKIAKLDHVNKLSIGEKRPVPIQYDTVELKDVSVAYSVDFYDVHDTYLSPIRLKNFIEDYQRILVQNFLNAILKEQLDTVAMSGTPFSEDNIIEESDENLVKNLAALLMDATYQLSCKRPKAIHNPYVVLPVRFHKWLNRAVSYLTHINSIRFRLDKGHDQIDFSRCVYSYGSFNGVNIIISKVLDENVGIIGDESDYRLILGLKYALRPMTFSTSLMGQTVFKQHYMYPPEQCYIKLDLS